MKQSCLHAYYVTQLLLHKVAGCCKDCHHIVFSISFRGFFSLTASISKLICKKKAVELHTLNLVKKLAIRLEM